MQILNVPVTVTASGGSVAFTAQIQPVSANWTTVAACLNIAGDGIPLNKTPAPPNMVYVATAAPTLIPITVDSACISNPRAVGGVYQAALVIQSTPPGSAADPAPIPIRIRTFGVGQTQYQALSFEVSGPPQQILIPISNLGTTTHTFTISYVPNPTLGTALPATNVSFIDHGVKILATAGNTVVTGPIVAGGQAVVSVEVSSAGLPAGMYTGQFLATSNSSDPGGPIPRNPYTLPVYVGPHTNSSGNRTLGLMLPVNLPSACGGSLSGGLPTAGAYPVTFCVPAGYAAPQLPGGPSLSATTAVTAPVVLQVTGLDNVSSSLLQVRQLAIAVNSGPISGAAFPATAMAVAGLDNGLTWAGDFLLPGNFFIVGRPAAWELAIDTTLLPVGTYAGTITFSPEDGATKANPLVVPFTLIVTAAPQLSVTQPDFFPNAIFTKADSSPFSETIAGTPLPAAGVTLSAPSGGTDPSCAPLAVNATGGSFGPPFNGGIPSVTIDAPSVPWLTIGQPPAALRGTVPTLGQLGVYGPLSPIPGAALFAAGPSPVGTGMQTFQVCADPSRVPANRATLRGSVVIHGAGTTTVPVTFLVDGGTPSSSGASQLGVFRPSAPVGGASGFFVLDANGNNQYDPGADQFRSFGLAGDMPIAGDWDGTGVTRIGVVRCPPAGQGLCTWYLDLNNNGQFDASDAVFAFGLPGDTPVVGDWNGSGVTKAGVMRCPTPLAVCTWYLDAGNTRTPSDPSNLVLSYGLTGDRPGVGPWAGGPVDRIGVFRCTVAGCIWIVDSNGDGQYEPVDALMPFGLAGDLPVVGNWNGNGTKRIGVFRPSTGQWFLDTNGDGQYQPSDQIANFGLPGDKPVVGFWSLSLPRMPF